MGCRQIVAAPAIDSAECFVRVRCLEGNSARDLADFCKAVTSWGKLWKILTLCAAAVGLFLPRGLFAQRYPMLLVPGSPQGIFTMMQDSQSRLWMGTIDDVYCFDGVRFYSLRKYGFPKEVPNAFGEDDEGGIWIGTQGTASGGGSGHGALYRYQAGHIEKVLSGDNLSVVQVAPGEMLASFGTEAEGHPTYGDLYRLRKKQEGWISDQLLEKRVHHMSVDKQGTTLFPCPGGWCELARQNVLEAKENSKIALQEHAGDPLIERVLRPLRLPVVPIGGQSQLSVPGRSCDRSAFTGHYALRRQRSP
jgi:hypothetical protein